MAAPRTTFTKRQKERARQERQAEKAQKKAQRKMESQNAPDEETRKSGNPVITYDEEGMPQALDFHDF